MKFSEYVGHEKTKEIKKSVKTNINSIENTDEIKINDNQIYFGFGINKQDIKRVYDYIKSWFVRYHIPFNSINPYLTLYIINNIPINRRDFIKDVKNSKNNIIFEPEEEGHISIIQKSNKIIDVRLDYLPNYFYMEDVLENIFKKFNIKVIQEDVYVRLFEIEVMIDEQFLDDMMYSCPPFPNLKLGNVGLIRRKNIEI